MTGEQIIQKINELGIEPQHIYFFDNGRSMGSDVTAKEQLEKNFGQVVSVDDGSVFDSEDIYRVLHFVEHGVYLKVEGWNSSWDGINFDDENNQCYSIVKPTTETKTVYV